MIKLQDLTPQVYYNQSRDFQFIGRLYDLVLNYLKTNSDNLYNLPLSDNTNEQTLSLLATTLGFKMRRNYDSKQLVAVCSVLPKVLKYKGSLKSVLIAAQAILNANGISQKLIYDIEENNTKLVLYVSSYLTNLNLLYDLLDYILPAGMSFNIIQGLVLTYDFATTLGIESNVTVETKDMEEFTWSAVSNLRNLSFNSSATGVIGTGSIGKSNKDIDIQPIEEGGSN